MGFHWKIRQQLKVCFYQRKVTNVDVLFASVHFTLSKYINTTLIQCYHYCLFCTGLSFWKCPRRKVYAVSQKDIRDSTPISSWKRSLILDSDEEDFEPRSKKERKEEKLDMILSEVGGIKEAPNYLYTR